MGEVVPLDKRRPRLRKLSTKRWQLLINACRELYYSPDLKVRKESHQQTEIKILGMLSKHFGPKQASIVLEMILLSYKIYFEGRVWGYRHKDFDAAGLHREISHVLAVAHMQANISTVYQTYTAIQQKVRELEVES